MKSDMELRHDVEQELEWEPSIDARRIGVTVADGIVTLTGVVGSYSERWKAERVVERLPGVKGIANDIVVEPTAQRSDTDIAKAAVDALKWNVLVPSDRIKVKVDNGWVRLTGEVNWDYQRRAAERAVRDLPGVKGITNLIAVVPGVAPEQVKKKIEEALTREALMDAQGVEVDVSGSTVTLRGTVRSWVERREAETAAWAAPGVSEVRNEISVKAAA